ncbi:iron complex transport system substrate-binding protein [Gordonia malaquae]|uniref:Putative ABC transporter substrate-binding protein n=1 Tax=Gordonia malaquae NBRC 108250 TaxID=1223542 RepID=M3UYH6_GORML|nr:ABC transporter substrate-binding protein [Gordonia malaquae]GAC80917.1 putative ABC transporter substrate-binding protein [Gordonia malaquae NBRC 108250]SED70683.1 iron complex transport system substrate-binding protein [Gordonia malaquae]
MSLTARRALIGSTVLILALAGCGATDPEPPSTSAAGFPVTLQNCGQSLTVDAPPQRIVSLNQGSTEVLLSLGLADRMAGTATWTDPVLPSLADANARVKRISDDWPSFEAVLAEEPDLVTASFGSTLGKGGTAPRQRFTDLGVPTYLAPSDCEGKNDTGGDGSRDEPMTLDSVYKEITELGALTATTDRATALIAELKGRAQAAADSIDARGTRVAYWFSDSESPYLAGCCGAPGVITSALGLTNVFDDTHDEWPQINWEVVASRNPDVLVLGDLTRDIQTGESAQGKIAFLESNPVTREMDAVKNKRYILLSGAAMNPSLRTVYGISDVAAGLKRLGLGR